jgi:hypothetical protein
MILEVLICNDIIVLILAIDDWFLLMNLGIDYSHVLEVGLIQLLIGYDVIVIEIGWELFS